jgi:hypothetical protein
MRIQTEANKIVIPSPLPSSMEGHALIIISGSGFSVRYPFKPRLYLNHSHAF